MMAWRHPGGAEEEHTVWEAYIVVGLVFVHGVITLIGVHCPDLWGVAGSAQADATAWLS